MTRTEQKAALDCTVKAAWAVGKLMRQNLRAVKKVDSATQHDIKLELDVRCQKLIEKTLHAAFPQISVVGEEGSAGDAESDYRWIVDPIDGTVNFSYGIPHACVSIALQGRSQETGVRSQKPGVRSQESEARDQRGEVITGRASRIAHHVSLLGVVYDPFTDEMFTAIRGHPARLNGQVIRVSRRNRLNESVLATGFAKSKEVLGITLPFLNRIVHRIRKVRIMGSAALSLAYVAAGRFDAYVETGIRLWDIAAGAVLVECAGGEFWSRPIPGTDHGYDMIASNGLLRKQVEACRPFQKT